MIAQWYGERHPGYVLETHGDSVTVYWAEDHTITVFTSKDVVRDDDRAPIAPADLPPPTTASGSTAISTDIQQQGQQEQQEQLQQQQQQSDSTIAQAPHQPGSGSRSGTSTGIHGREAIMFWC